MTRTRRPLLLFALALLLAAGLGAWQGRQERADPPAVAETAAPVAATDDAGAAVPAEFSDTPPVPELPGLPPLPHASMRLGEAWPALEARALAGDWRAGCRLADALSGCDELAGMRRSMLREFVGREPAAPLPDCREVPTALVQRRAIYRLAAAQAGHRASAEAFVAGIEFPHTSLNAAGAVPALIAYRDHVIPMRIALLEQGSVVAAMAAWTHDWMPPGDGPKRDDERALMAGLASLGIRSLDPPSPSEPSGRVLGWLARMTPEELGRWRESADTGHWPVASRWLIARNLGEGDPSCMAASP